MFKKRNESKPYISLFGTAVDGQPIHRFDQTNGVLNSIDTIPDSDTANNRQLRNMTEDLMAQGGASGLIGGM